MDGFWTWNHENQKNLRIALTQPYEVGPCFWGPGKSLTGAPCFWPQRNSTTWQFCDCDLFGMVKWPFKGRIVTSNWGIKRSRLESPGMFFFSCVKKISLQLTHGPIYLPQKKDFFFRFFRTESEIMANDSIRTRNGKLPSWSEESIEDRWWRVKDDATEVSENLHLFPFP